YPKVVQRRKRETSPRVVIARRRRRWINHRATMSPRRVPRLCHSGRIGSHRPPEQGRTSSPGARPVPAQDREPIRNDHALPLAAPARSQPNRDLGAVGSPKMSVAPLQFLLLVFAGWVNRRQLEIVEFLQ